MAKTIIKYTIEVECDEDDVESMDDVSNAVHEFVNQLQDAKEEMAITVIESE